MFEKERQGIIMALLDVKNVRKVYTTRFGGNQVEALKDVNFSVEQGEYVAIMDGILTSLKMMEVMMAKKKKLSQSQCNP